MRYLWWMEPHILMYLFRKWQLFYFLQFLFLITHNFFFFCSYHSDFLIPCSYYIFSCFFMTKDTGSWLQLLVYYSYKEFWFSYYHFFFRLTARANPWMKHTTPDLLKCVAGIVMLSHIQLPHTKLFWYNKDKLPPDVAASEFRCASLCGHLVDDN